LLTGFEIYGPFDTVELAVAWAEKRTLFLGPVTVMPIRPPESFGVHVSEDEGGD
jgi:hypothetical protein